MAADHSPLPWEISEIDHGDYNEIEIVAPAEHWSTVVFMGEAFRARNVANAEFIVRACNSHHELLAACKLALGAFERNDAIDWADLERAIAIAEGK